MNKCNHDKPTTELIFHGKATAIRKRHPTGGRPKLSIIESRDYKTVTIVCDFCKIDWTVPYNRAPSWVKNIMEELNKKAPISEGKEK